MFQEHFKIRVFQEFLKIRVLQEHFQNKSFSPVHSLSVQSSSPVIIQCYPSESPKWVWTDTLCSLSFPYNPSLRAIPQECCPHFSVLDSLLFSLPKQICVPKPSEFFPSSPISLLFGWYPQQLPPTWCLLLCQRFPEAAHFLFLCRPQCVAQCLRPSGYSVDIEQRNKHHC